MRIPHIVVATLLTAALVGCSGESSDDESTSTPSPSSSSTSETETETPDETGEEADPDADADAEEPGPGAAEDAEDAGDEDQNAALDSYVEAERAALPAALEQFPGMYASADVAAEYPSTVVFSYTYAEAVDPAAAGAELEAQIPDMQSALEEYVFPAMEDAGVTGDLKATYSYYNPDGTQVWTFTALQP